MILWLCKSCAKPSPLKPNRNQILKTHVKVNFESTQTMKAPTRNIHKIQHIHSLHHVRKAQRSVGEHREALQRWSVASKRSHSVEADVDDVVISSGWRSLCASAELHRCRVSPENVIPCGSNHKCTKKTCLTNSQSEWINFCVSCR